MVLTAISRSDFAHRVYERRSRTDPLVGQGRHFGRTVNAFCRVFPLMKEGISRQLQLQAGVLDEDELTDQ